MLARMSDIPVSREGEDLGPDLSESVLLAASRAVAGMPARDAALKVVLAA